MKWQCCSDEVLAGDLRLMAYVRRVGEDLKVAVCVSRIAEGVVCISTAFPSESAGRHGWLCG